MNKCLDCDNVFDNPLIVCERHGLDTPPYEEIYTCPKCKSAEILDAFQCDGCGEYVCDNFIKTTNGKIFCDNCYCLIKV